MSARNIFKKIIIDKESNPKSNKCLVANGRKARGLMFT